MRRILTHVILVFLTSIILFPIFWVVMTSLRRDEAAFSPKLFSSNLTLQHYKDLIFPPDNVPALVRDLSSLIALFPPYEQENPERVLKKIEKKLRKLKSHIEETRKLGNEAFQMYEALKKSLEADFEDVVSGTVREFERTISVLSENDLKCDDETMLAIGYVSKRIGKWDWYTDICNVSREKIREIYENKIGIQEEKISEISKKMESLNISSLKSKLSFLSLEYTETLEDMKPLSEDLRRSLRSFMKALEIPGNIPYRIDDLSSKVSNLLEKMENIEDLNSMSGILKDFSRFISERGEFKVSKEALKILENLKIEIESLLEDVRYQVQNLLTYLDEFKTIEKELNEKSERRRLLEIELQKLKGKLERRISSLKDRISKVYSVYLKVDMEKKLEKIKTMKKPTKSNLLKLQVYERSLRSKLREAQDFYIGKEKSESLENALKTISWASDYRSFSSAVSKLEREMPKLLDEFEREYESLSAKWKKIFELARTGVKAPPGETDRMYEILGSQYEGKVSSALGIAMREARVLMDSFPVKDSRKVFKTLDSLLYRIQQMWNKKPRHFFLRWVWNSVFVAGTVALITTFVCAIGAYPFSRMNFRGRRYGIMSLLLIQMFPAIMYMVALYGMLKFLGERIPWLGLDTLGGLIFVYLGGIAFNMYLIKGYYDTIPSSLEESAMIDGATRFQTFWMIVVPLARPILAVVVILTFIGTFNEFVLARIILQDVRNYTYALGLWSFSTGPFETEWGLFTAAALLGMLPMVVLFLSMQRFLISGLTKGSVKG